MMKTSNNKSELEQLLEKPGLTVKEFYRASKLILDNPVFSKKNCWVCKMYNSDNIKKAIFDTGLCQNHAMDALTKRGFQYYR